MLSELSMNFFRTCLLKRRSREEKAACTQPILVDSNDCRATKCLKYCYAHAQEPNALNVRFFEIPEGKRFDSQLWPNHA